MKHNIEELMRVWNATTVNTYATVEYCQEQGIPMPKSRKERVAAMDKQWEGYTFAMPASSHTNNGKPINVLDKGGKTKVIYLFGEKTWFDTEEELIAYRTAYNEQRTKMKERNDLKRALLSKVEMMTTNELRTLVEQL